MKKAIRKLVRVRTPWCSSDVLVPYFTAPKVRALVDRWTGSCPSGETFNSVRFWADMAALRPGWRKERIGPVANLPWGRVADAIAFYPG